ncbi:unnamed protein product [Moneuplotes crassus]|uniref:Uncharacterized protein n=1 Tax=Euplotes crassus TaxID=5936 RepID=A0AAD1U434_EUPCR|nr:unnamed protein product [Moneuplotes crassus]
MSARFIKNNLKSVNMQSKTEKRLNSSQLNVNDAANVEIKEFIRPNADVKHSIKDAIYCKSIDLKEHWDTLLLDEVILRKHMSYEDPNKKLCSIRKYIIDKIFDFGDSLGLRNITLQAAIIYAEILLSKSKLDILDKDKDLWAATTLLLSSKYIELDDSIPFISHFRKLGLDSYNEDIFIKSESVLLKALNWEMMVVTPLHYLECILNYCALFGDDKIRITDHHGNKMNRYTSNIEFEYEGDKRDQLRTTVSSVQKYSEIFVDICIQSKKIQKYSYSVQAIYSLLAAREMVGVEPVWNPQFDNFTGLYKSQISREIEEIKGIINESNIIDNLYKTIDQTNYAETLLQSSKSQISEDDKNNSNSSNEDKPKVLGSYYKAPSCKKLKVNLYQTSNNCSTSQVRSKCTSRSRASTNDTKKYQNKAQKNASKRITSKEMAKSFYVKRSSSYALKSSRNYSGIIGAKSSISTTRNNYKIPSKNKRKRSIIYKSNTRSNCNSRANSKVKKPKNFIKSNIENVNTYCEPLKSKRMLEERPGSIITNFRQYYDKDLKQKLSGKNCMNVPKKPAKNSMMLSKQDCNRSTNHLNTGLRERSNHISDYKTTITSRMTSNSVRDASKSLVATSTHKCVVSNLRAYSKPKRSINIKPRKAKNKENVYYEHESTRAGSQYN